VDRTFDTLLVEGHGPHVVVATLNRPEARNALNTQMGQDLVRFFEEVAADPAALRCIVLTGAGDRAFCAGGDLKERNGMSDRDWELQHLVFERMARGLVDCPVPLIGAVNGAAFGGGCEIAAACDFLYASRSARFAQPEVSLGIIPGAGGTQHLARAMGQRRALEVILTGRPFGAGEAMEWGLVNAVVDPEDLMATALSAADAIARNAPLATRQAKQAVVRGMRMALPEGMAFEIEAYNRCVPTEDRREGVRAFNEKRSPRFTGT
jgi:enoyl-CoA hydratase/carnithine racemase